MKMGIGTSVPDLANLPGPSRPGGGGGSVVDTFPFKIQLDLTGQTFPYTFQIQKVTVPNVTTEWVDGST